MPSLAYFTIIAIILVIIAVVLFLTGNPLGSIFVVLLALFSLKLEELNE